MKNIFFFLLSLSLFITGCKDNSFKVSGKLNKPVEGEYLFLQELKANELTTLDSVKMNREGTFTFEREIEMPMLYLLKTSNTNFLMILAEPGDNIKIAANYHSLNLPESITGSEGSKKMLEYNNALKNTITKLSSLNETYMQNSDSPDLPKIIQTLDSTVQVYLKEINTYTKKYIDQNINSLISLVALYQQVAQQVYVLDPVQDIGYFVKVDSSLYKQYPESEPVKSLHEQVQALIERVNMEKGAVVVTGTGNPVPEIALPSPSGETIKLSSTRGNIVLLDFWASWCSPCRRENPNLVNAYNKFKNKGFQIFQVSLDKTKDDWIKGIEQDKLGQWIHVSDLKYWNSSVVPLYKIESIPYNLLLDAEGKVIASNLRGEQLMVKLQEVYNRQ
jgi:thiol-disulfide isomerase/thioredoxin